MAIGDKSAALEVQRPARVRSKGHVAPQAPSIDIRFPGRLRTSHVLALLGISHSTLYTRIQAGSIPAADGRDGPLSADGSRRGRLYWNTATIRSLLGE